MLACDCGDRRAVTLLLGYVSLCHSVLKTKPPITALDLAAYVVSLLFGVLCMKCGRFGPVTQVCLIIVYTVSYLLLWFVFLVLRAEW